MLLYFGLAVLLCTGMVGAAFPDISDSLVIKHDEIHDLVEASMLCSVKTQADLDAKTNIEIRVTASENDTSAEYNNGTLLHYGSCMQLNTTAYLDTLPSGKPDLIRLCNLTRQGTDPLPSTDSAVRTYQNSHKIDASSNGESDCGMVVDAAGIYTAVLCERYPYHHSIESVVLNMACSWDSVVVRTLKANQSVGGPKDVKVQSFFKVDFDVVRAVNKAAAGNHYPHYPPFPIGADFEDISTTGANLGDVLQFTLSISQVGSHPYFPDNNFAPIGIYPKTCTVWYDFPTDSPTTNSMFEPMKDGCSTGQVAFPFLSDDDVVPDLSVNEWVPRYDDDGLPDQKMRTPNIQWWNVEVVLPAYVKADWDFLLFNWTCGVGYCVNTTDPMCFYNGTASGLTKPDCPNTAGRRKRSDDEDNWWTYSNPNGQSYDSDLWGTLPDTMGVVFRVNNPRDEDADIITAADVNKERQGCLEKKAFFAVTIAIGILLLIVFALAIVIFFKIRINPSDAGSSQEGFTNKGYK